MDKATRGQTLLNLAQLVVESNVENYKQKCADERTKPKLRDFARYGVDTETVEMIIKDLTAEVIERVKKFQPLSFRLTKKEGGEYE